MLTTENISQESRVCRSESLNTCVQLLRKEWTREREKGHVDMRRKETDTSGSYVDVKLPIRFLPRVKQTRPNRTKADRGTRDAGDVLLFVCSRTDRNNCSLLEHTAVEHRPRVFSNFQIFALKMY